MPRPLLRLAFAGLALCAAGVVLAAPSKSPQQPRSTSVKAKVNYLTFLPKSYSAKGEKVPLIVFLHGSGERGSDLDKVKAWGPPAIVEKDPDFPFMVVSPQIPEGQWWDTYLLKSMLDDVLKRYNVDPKRVYLTGISMGGYGAWDLAIKHPDYFAAVAPICGGGIARMAGRLKDVPVWAFHGLKDEAVPEAESARMVDALRAQGGKVKYTVLPEAGHIEAWVHAYGEAGLFDWFAQQRRQ
ncbi:prolyl oligopeptidase family serine peptidase [Telluria aromaticivorans]|uniref:Prolyl oligopeptidase family serine peptidase n=1 Tax=Telluria aromaticivorans TaxID=2725995 RepID=A0A7Y2JXH8_9BURK|nr:prolyl oligopeptidase family serine peptidase [Telluria aromaticivorans]NNG22345.1 prolyl oligopeptidase family serine peptidase [Telluria aromaticivorans]